MLNLFNKAVLNVFDSPRFFKRFIATTIDISLAFLSFWLAICIREESLVSINQEMFSVGVFSALLILALFFSGGIYGTAIRTLQVKALYNFIFLISVYVLIFAPVVIFFPTPKVPRSIAIIQPMLLFFFTVGIRVLARDLYRNTLADKKTSQAFVRRVLIYGAGKAGKQLGLALQQEADYQCCGYIDDDSSLQGIRINGQKVYNVNEIDELINRYKVTEILLAMPTLSKKDKINLLNRLRPLPVAVRTVPGLREVLSGTNNLSEIQDLDILDFIGRSSVEDNAEAVLDHLRDQIVLITGAGGSIGSELSRQILTMNPKVLILVDNSEYSLYSIDRELSNQRSHTELWPVLLDIKNIDNVLNTFEYFKPDVVFHAAAYKHVPLVEANPKMAVENNVFGTLHLVKASMKFNVKSFLLISTDKAVRPTNIMGATKRLAEHILQTNSLTDTNTKFAMVRFGNVIGSSGSVVPLFRNQINSGGPVTVTHPEVTRYFMTIPEAVQLVLKASSAANGGEIFVLEMGGPVKIFDLAKRMIELMGHNWILESSNDEGIMIQFTGLRPGEKLFEELVLGDSLVQTGIKGIQKANENVYDEEKLNQILSSLDKILKKKSIFSVVELKKILSESVEGYSGEKNTIESREENLNVRNKN